MSRTAHSAPRRFGRWSWPLRRRWHRTIRPLRRPVRVVVVLAILAVMAFGFYADVQTTPRSTARGSVELAEDSTLVLQNLGTRGDARLAGLRDGDRITVWDGRPVTPARADSLARRSFLFRAAPGDSLPLRVQRGGRSIGAVVVMDRRSVEDARQFGLSNVRVRWWAKALFILATLAFAGAGLALFIRARARGYGASLGTALLAVAGSTGFVQFTDWDGSGMSRTVAVVLLIVAIAIFVSAFPAIASALVRFPDGRYVPRWTRYVRRAAALGLVAFLATIIVVEQVEGVQWVMWIGIGGIFGLLALPIVGLAQKYRQSTNGVVRQQMKWVLLPLGAFFGVSLLTLLAEMVPAFDSSKTATGYLFGATVSYAGALTFAAIPLGVLAGVLGFRPWDADAWIAKSAAIGAATLGLAAVFAGGAEAIRLALRSSFGEGADPIAAALAAVISLFAFNPVREWFTRRAERELERTREILGERLPLVLAGRQVVASPSEIGRVAIRGLRDALQTDRAAVIDLDPEGWEVVAAEGIGRAAALEWVSRTMDPAAMPACAEQVWEDPTFVLRVPLRSAEDELVGVLALGTHGKGRGYSTAEREAVDGVSRPLAEALRVAERREEAEARRNERLATMMERFL